MTRAELIAALEAATGPSRELDCEIFEAMGGVSGDWFGEPITSHWHDTGGVYLVHTETGLHLQAKTAPRYTSSIDAALTLVPEDWWVTVGVCALSGHASIGPDYNGPHGERLRLEYSEDAWHDGIDADHRLGNGPSRAAIALCIAALKAGETPK